MKALDFVTIKIKTKRDNKNKFLSGFEIETMRLKICITF